MPVKAGVGRPFHGAFTPGFIGLAMDFLCISAAISKERPMIATEPRINVIPYPETPQYEAPRHRHMAVMFVDLDHFMRICIDDPPEAVFGLLNDFQRVVTDLVSSFKGELNSYQGDGVLVTFDDAAEWADCATRALRCARKTLEKIRALSFEHTYARGRSVSVSIGLQYGETWTSTLHTSRSFGPTLIGDAVNVAARLEQQAQTLGTTMVAGDDLIQKAWCESASTASDLAQFVSAGPLLVRGRCAPVHVWKLRTHPCERLLENAAAHNGRPDVGPRHI
jgi:class 3 adenylate cyclase